MSGTCKIGTTLVVSYSKSHKIIIVQRLQGHSPFTRQLSNVCGQNTKPNKYGRAGITWWLGEYSKNLVSVVSSSRLL